MKIYSIVLFILISGCSQHNQQVVITKDYVTNPNWDENNNSIFIVRMKLKDTSDILDLGNVNQGVLLEKLIEDTSFSYSADVEYNGESYSKRKVFFNKYNGFLWRKDIYKSSKVVLGELEKNNWYKFAGLSIIKTKYYVYIDSFDNVHSFDVMISNW